MNTATRLSDFCLIEFKSLAYLQIRGIIMKFLRILLILAFLFPSVASAANYEVSVTRKGSNLYKVDGKDIYINTRLCYEYAYSEDTILQMSGYQGYIIFLESGDRYDVKSVFGKINQASGTYSVTVNKEEDDWYSVQGMDIYIKTNGCFGFAFYEKAVLTISGNGYGTLYVGGSQCMVEGLYSRLNL